MALLSAFAGAAYWQPWKALANQPAISAGEQSPPVLRTVNVERPTMAAAGSVVLPATVQPWQQATLHARVSGYVRAWFPDLGTPVKTGEVLAELDTPELDQELAEAIALAREADAAAAQARAERAEAQADLKVAAAQLERVQAEAELARTQLSRRAQLLERRAISQEEFETFQRDVAVRTADVEATEADVVRRRTNLATRAAVIAAREATAKSRQSNVDRLEELERFKLIIAPFDGIITRRAAEVGALITAGQEPLYVVEDMTRVRVQLQVPQTYARQTAVGAAARVSLPESPQSGIDAVVTRLADAVDPVSRTMLAEIELDNSAHEYQPGSYAQVTLTTPSTAAWTIPSNTVHMRVDGPYVVTVNDHDEIDAKPVVLGRDLGSQIVATAGIEGHERLVINPSDDLQRGDRVQVSEPQGIVPGLARR
ncbi:MAG: efflux RND transporter periplasmic adaptor subunit [Pirellulales bacterium]